MKARIGIVGSGFTAQALAITLKSCPDLDLSGILTRRKGKIPGLEFAKDLILHDPEVLMERSDLIVTLTGDPIYSTEIIYKAFLHNLPAITMESETQVVSGSWLCRQGTLSEAEGDQPGCLAALKEEAENMGFEPVVYGNIKGFLNHVPTQEEMVYWSKQNGTSIEQTTNFTDGTKLQIEQAHVANAFGVDIVKQGLVGPNTEDLNQGAEILAAEANKVGEAISDYIVSRNAPRGVFIVAKHDARLKEHLRFWSLGEGPNYVLYKPVHLCSLEIPKTIRQLLSTKRVLMNNSPEPKISVGGIAKVDLKRGDFIKRATGSFVIRGEALRINEHLNHIPIGLIQNAFVKRNIEPGQIIEFDDLELRDSIAMQAWSHTLSSFLKPANKRAV